MAEPPKPKRPSRSKKAPAPDFSPFEDWLIDGPAGDWPRLSRIGKELSEQQRRIVADNASVLADRKVWFRKVEAFEAALAALADEDRQKQERAKYHIRIDRHVFADGPKDFSNYLFPCTVSFDGTAFGKGDVSFDSATFSDGNVSFRAATFDRGDVSFQWANFGEGNVSFNAANFGEGIVWFDRATFGEGNVSFDRAKFGKGNVSFRGATFGEGNVLFRKATFGEGKVWFSGVTFAKGNVSFSKATFGKDDVWFNDATFGEGNVSYSRTIFGEGNVWFSRVKFDEGNVWFNEAKFGKGTVSFRGATFGKGNIWFSDIAFQSTTKLALGVVFAGNLYVKSHFPMLVDFSRLDVKGTASFSGSSFAKVPDFRDAKFDRPPEVAYMRVPKPRCSPPKAWIVLGRWIHRYRGIEDAKVETRVAPEIELSHDPDDDGVETDASDATKRQPGWLKRSVAAISSGLYQISISFFRLATDPGEVAKFRKLKSMALAANDHEKDGEFFAGEMLAKRGTETRTFFGLLFNSLYWWLSDFGQSFVRPLLWLGGSFVAFAGLCLYLIRDTLTPDDRLWFAVDFSFRNMLPLFGSLFRFAAAPKDHVSWYQKTYEELATAGVDIDRLISLGIAQNLIGTVLLFLFLLALRNKYRLK